MFVQSSLSAELWCVFLSFPLMKSQADFKNSTETPVIKMEYAVLFEK